MAVTELALLKCKGDGSLTEPIKDELRKAKVAMETYTGKMFYYLQQVEEPAYIYVLGEWESLEDHYEGFIASKENKDTLVALADMLEVQWLMHLDLPIANIQLDAPLLSLGRLSIAAANREAFTTNFESIALAFRADLTEGEHAFGWKQEPSQDGAHVFVVFAPWRDTEQHFHYAGTEAAKEQIERMSSFARSVERKHVKVLNL